jgi:hypothetical protein
VTAAAPEPREARRLDLGRRSKSQLASMVRRGGLLWSAHPPEKWEKSELVGTILDREFPPAAADVSSPEPTPPGEIGPRNETAAPREDETRPCRLCGGGPHAGHKAWCRDERGRDLDECTKPQLAALLSRCAPGPGPLTSWRKDELVSAVLDREYPAPAAAPEAPGPAPQVTPCARPGCPEMIRQAPTGRPARYHSAACRQAAHRDRARRSEAAGLAAAQLADAREALAVIWPQIEPAADDVAELAGRIASYAAHEDPEDRGALALALGELRAAVDRLESLALTFRATDDRAAALGATASDPASAS